METTHPCSDTKLKLLHRDHEFNRMVPHSGQSTGLPSSPRKPRGGQTVKELQLAFSLLLTKAAPERIGAAVPLHTLPQFP